MADLEESEEIAQRSGRPGYLAARARIMRRPERPLIERVRSQEKTARKRWAGMTPAEREEARARVAARSPYITFVGRRPPGAPRLDKHGHRLLTQGFQRRDWRDRSPRG